jgi:hypothetical protein
MMAPADAFFTAQELARRFTAIMLAIVNSYVKIEDDLKFVSMVGNNRGALIEIYRTQDEAEAWLLR